MRGTVTDGGGQSTVLLSGVGLLAGADEGEARLRMGRVPVDGRTSRAETINGDVMAILEYATTELGYCQQCGRACAVGKFRITFWKHVFYVCASCLREAAKTVDEQTTRE